jgi:Fic family protein
MTYVLQLSDDPHFRHSSATLRSLHFMMLEYDLTKHPGQWRPGPVFVQREPSGEIVYEGPEVEFVPALIDELVESLSSPEPGTPDLIAAAMAHLNLVMIHPFSDGNGRMARCLQTLVLGRLGVLAPEFSSIEEYLGNEKQGYYAVLANVGGPKWNPEGNAYPWIRFCLTAHFRQASRVLRRSRVIEEVYNAVERVVTAKHGFPDRCVLAVVDATFSRHVRNTTYRKLAEISDQVAGKDLRELVRAGLLIPQGEKRGRVYVVSDEVREATQRIRIPKIVEDPYAESDSYLPGMTPEKLEG